MPAASECPKCEGMGEVLTGGRGWCDPSMKVLRCDQCDGTGTIKSEVDEGDENESS
jgi:DnaJ-class molecular chaperone